MKRFFMLSVGLVVILCAALYLVTPKAWSLDKIGYLTTLKFPPGSVLQEEVHEGGWNPWVVARVSIPTDKVKTFVLQFDDEKWEDGAYLNWSDRLKVDNTAAAGKFVAKTSGDPFVACLLILDDPTSAVLYLQHYE